MGARTVPFTSYTIHGDNLNCDEDQIRKDCPLSTNDKGCHTGKMKSILQSDGEKGFTFDGAGWDHLATKLREDESEILFKPDSRKCTLDDLKGSALCVGKEIRSIKSG